MEINNDQLEKLKQLFPEVVTEGKIDWEKLQVTLGKENIEFSNERYVLNWAGKTDAFKVLQQPTTATLKPSPEESINFETTNNVFIEGENLETLKVLQKAYYGKVKCIIIDPPYNTGSDSFIYPDSFKESKEEYQKRIGEKDEDGYLLKEGMFHKNNKDSGHFHSNWLSMMYPRLFLAKNLLKDNGVIFVHIDDNEVHNLRLIMNEIFGEENFLAQICRPTGTPTGGGFKAIVNEFDYILLYSKTSDTKIEGLPLTLAEEKIYDKEDSKGRYLIRPLRRTGGEDRREDRPSMYYPLKSPDGQDVFPVAPAGYESRWICGIDKYNELLEEGLIEWKKSNKEASESWIVYQKFYLEGRLKQPSNLWDNIEGNKKASRDLRELMKGKLFDFPKPIELIKKCLQITSDKDSLIVDFFAGSGTTAQAVLELNKEDTGNRKFILVQLPEKCDEKSEAFKEGYKMISDITKERIRRVIKKIEQTIKENKDLLNEEENENLDLGFRVFKLSSSNFKIWRGNDITEDNLETQLSAFTNPVREGSEQENMLYELMLKSGYQLTDKVELRNKYYAVNKGELIIAVNEMSQNVVDEIIKARPKKVVTLDKLFAGNDQLKTNTALQMRDAEIDFKTI